MSYKRNLLPKMAVERLQNNPQALFVDVRSKAEFKYVGYPENSILIPWIDDPDWEPNPEAFSDAVMQELDGRENLSDTEIILICRSGFRSNEALKCLENKGFTQVSHVASGFEGDLDENDHRGNLNGWRHDGMPWSQS
ncbi:MAG: rhodanese-like domain-containing protein [Candidatus Marinimicrobia bacterium]|jgi:rhodanese-related sulfurtransferase|nr:rhodanese-like domain-containing protein [Candidatus Neomarinimicrobiota bacterium]